MAQPGSCSNCFFSMADVAGNLRCHRSNPNPDALGEAEAWPIVQSNDWCGEGYNTTTNAPMQPTPGAQATGAAMPVWIAPNPNPGGTLSHIGAPGSYLIRSGAGWITGISVNSVSTGAGTLTCYDGLSATGTVIAIMDVSKGNPSPQTAAPWAFQTGFFIVLSANATGADLTIVSHSV
jgi:hypothetical protein